GDVDWIHLRGSATSGPVTYPLFAPAAFVITSSATADWVAMIRGRVGFAANNWLFYATGGAAFTDLKGNFTFTDNCNAVPTCSTGNPSANEALSLSSNTKVGWTVGGGFEYAIGNGWSIKGEYLYLQFDRISAIGFINPAIPGSDRNPF